MSNSSVEYEIVVKYEMQNILLFLDIFIKVEKSYKSHTTSTSLSITSIVQKLKKII